jgi:diadenosine tetraphosphate (Ap4A) HIT family hydrolase
MSTCPAPHDTLLKFGYPHSLVREYGRWSVLARPHQATLGALVLVCREPAQAFSQISDEAFGELGGVIRDIEAGLQRFGKYDKINYLMLMMVDREVHYHVLPRYAEDQVFHDRTFADPGWPAAPDLSAGPVLEGADLALLVGELKAAWSRIRDT